MTIKYNKKELEGMDNLETDLEIYRILHDKQQQGDKLLGIYNIHFGYDQYKGAKDEDTNNIYIIRGQDNFIKKTTEAEWFNVHTQIIIHTNKYDIFEAVELLRSTYLRIMYYLHKEPLWSHSHIENRTQLYDETGRIVELAIDLTSLEVETTPMYHPERGYEYTIQPFTTLEHEELEPHISYNKKYPPINTHTTKTVENTTEDKHTTKTYDYELKNKNTNHPKTKRRFT